MRTAWIIASVLAMAACPASAQSADSCNSYQTEAQRSQCDAAISSEQDAMARADLLFRRAYSRVEAYDLDGALIDLNGALAISPKHSAAYHERAYIWGELGEYRKAVDDLDFQSQLSPDRVEVYTERAYARFFLGDLQGSYEDRARALKIAPESGESLLARGRAALWLGRFEEARSDIAAAEAMASIKQDADLRESANEDSRSLTLWMSATRGGDPAALCKEAGEDFKFHRPNLVGDCSAAFLAASDPKKKAEFLSVRGNVFTYGLDDETSGVWDLRMAVAFDPQNAGWLSNLGFAYLQTRHSWAAEREFDRSIALERTYYALAGRAAARFNQNDMEGAFNDAKASFEIQPNDAAFMVLGDIMLKKNDRVGAKQMWMAAYHLGGRDDRLMARLKDVGVTDPDKEPRE